MLHKVLYVTEKEMAAEAEEYVGGRPVSDFIGVPSADVYDDYCEWCEKEGRMGLTRYQFGRGFCIYTGTKSVPRRVRGRSARVVSYDVPRPSRAKRGISPEAGMRYATWERLSYERVDDYIRETCTFDGMEYREIYEEYSDWCEGQEFVPLPYKRFTSVFGRKWQKLDGYTLVERRNGKSTRIVHDPLPE